MKKFITKHAMLISLLLMLLSFIMLTIAVFFTAPALGSNYEAAVIFGDSFLICFCLSMLFMFIDFKEC